MKQVSIFLIIIAILLPLPSLAFDYNYILSDKELGDYSSMTSAEIQEFLSEHNSFLAYFADFYPDDNTFSTAADIIWKTAQKFYINPKFILALLEKEQSLISVQKPVIKRLDWAMGYAVCDKCRLSHPLVAQYKGFGKQVYYAINKISNGYLASLNKNGVTQSGFGPGITKKVDKIYKVTPVNNATAALYTYTPHIKGNQSIYIIWKNWFSNIKYPDGSLLQDVKTGGVYLIQNGEKRPFLHREALTSRFNENQIVQVVSVHLKKYPTGKPIAFANNSLLRDEKQNLYMVVNDEIRSFESYETFKSLGFNISKVTDITADELANFSPGQVITATTTYAGGALLQDKITGGVYWTLDDLKYPVPNKSVLSALFPKPFISRVDNKVLDALEKGDALKFADGALIKNESNSSVYFVSGGKLRPIPSEDVFMAYNWQWKNVFSSSEKIIALYEIGSPVTLDGDSTTSTVGGEDAYQTGEQNADDTDPAILTE